MITSKPKQPLLHALANNGRASDACDETGRTASVTCDRHKGFILPDMSCDPGESIARVTAVDRDQYLIRNAESEVPAKLTGRAVYSSVSPADLPCVDMRRRLGLREASRLRHPCEHPGCPAAKVVSETEKTRRQC